MACWPREPDEHVLVRFVFVEKLVGNERLGELLVSYRDVLAGFARLDPMRSPAHAGVVVECEPHARAGRRHHVTSGHTRRRVGGGNRG